jgi:transcriptional regulator with XRE-family HTH domain
MRRKQPASITGENGHNIGSRIRERRKALGLTLRDLSEQVDLSSSFIAQVERGQVTPSIPSLQLIANALQVPIFYFFIEEREEQHIVRKDGRRKIHFPDSNITYELLLPDLNYKSIGLIVRLGPRDRISPLRLSEQTEEWILVITGKIKLQIAGESYSLEPGDSIVYEGWELQEVASLCDEESQYVVGMTPPAF